MYCDLFKLTLEPFTLSPDPDFLYLSKAHARAKAYMETTVWLTDGFVVITGEIGCGKTTLIETFLHEHEQRSDIVIAQISQTQVSSTEFLQAVLVQFGLKPFQMKKAELLASINEFIIEQYSQNRKILLIVDEAQNLSKKVLEEIRMLSGIETKKKKVLRIVLAGQPELNEKLDAPELEQLAQRVRLRFHLPALSRAEMQAYILHRLEVAGSQGREIFLNGTFDVLFRYTGGVPRLINILCDTAMLAAFNAGRDTVQLEDVRAAIEELRWVEYGARTGLRPMRARPEDDREIDETSADDSAPVPYARVVLAIGGRTISSHPLYLGRMVIGRSRANDLQIDSGYISRHHCQIITTENVCVIEELNSTNGVLVHGKRVRSHRLMDGDIVTLGQHKLLYFDERTRPPGSEEFGTTRVLDDASIGISADPGEED